MKTLRFLTWLDVKRLIRKKTNYGNQLPEGVTGFNCFSDALEVSILGPDYKSIAESILQEWFSDWYQKEQSIIQLDLGNSVLPVEFFVEPLDGKESISFRPFWEEIAYINSDSETNLPKNLRLPQPYTTPPSLTAFYSFKGGVGRTIHLASHLFALLECARENEKAITILVIDADLEAPGLTYWDKLESQQPAVSFIDFLETYHYSPLPIEQILDLFAKEVKKSSKQEGRSTFYFLPACLSNEQLLDTPVLPEHLARSPDSEWTYGDAIYQLGQAVAADYVLIDLRAGLSEISSPLIFDPRVQRFFVTPATEQSVAGISLVLEQISRIAPSDADIDSNRYYDPSLIISFLTPELKSLPEFENALVRLRTSYIQATRSEEDSIYSKRLEIKETDFSQELLYINSWDEARQKLSSTSVMKVAREWAELQLKASIEADGLEVNSNRVELPGSLEEVRDFRNICQRYEFAESGEGEGLLVTEPLKNLATTFRDGLPRVVSIGAKGAGKTFIYVQLSRLKYWEKFIKLALKEVNESNLRTYIFPLLQSGTLRDAAEDVIKKARDSVRNALGDETPEFLLSECQDRIRQALQKNLNELEWTEFWIREVTRVVGIQGETPVTLSSLNSFLRSKQIRIIFLFDGLEDVFAEAASNVQQQIALRALINLPKRLSEIRQANLGLIILLRRDFLRYAITQNLAQFESLYRSYDLSWDMDSFLKLVYWVCSQANVIGANEAEIDALSREDLVARLERLWGEKLGGVREAYTASWVFAALTDFKGRLQARDIVRLLYHAAYITVQNAQEVQFERWSAERLLPPQAIRRALVPCSEKKVQEAKEEYPEFREWVTKIEREYTPDQKRIPFTLQDLNLDQATIRILEDMGVIYEDRAKDDDVVRYYMPEIFRTGLNFILEGGARPRVLVLKRKALGIGVL